MSHNKLNPRSTRPISTKQDKEIFIETCFLWYNLKFTYFPLSNIFALWMTIFYGSFHFQVAVNMKTSQMWPVAMVMILPREDPVLTQWISTAHSLCGSPGDVQLLDLTGSHSLCYGTDPGSCSGLLRNSLCSAVPDRSLLKPKPHLNGSEGRETPHSSAVTHLAPRTSSASPK